MTFFKHHHTRKALKWLLALVAFLVLIISISFTSYFLFEKKYEGKIYPGVYVGDINLGGKSQTEARETLNERVNILDRDGIIFSYQNRQSKILPTVSTVDGDFAYEVINFDIEKIVNKSLEIGRILTPIENLKIKIGLLIGSRNKPLKLYYSLNKDKIFETLKNEFSNFEKESANALLSYDNNQFLIKDEKSGIVIDYNLAISELKNNLNNFDLSNIVLVSKIENPVIFKDKTFGLVSEADALLSTTPITIIFSPEENSNKPTKNTEWIITKDIIANWIELKNSFDPASEKDKISLSFNEARVENYFSEYIYPEINIQPQNAKFEIKNGRVVEFQESKDGIEVNFQATLNLLNNSFFNKGEKNISLATTELKSKLQTQDVNDLGIKEIIGTGYSSFSGSPYNRRLNIATGAAALNGILIKPGEEFSILSALGEIDAESGYLPELVIKGNRTIPEYGGGLCQVSTTLFRAVLQSGLPVTQRKNHSYRVSYYEPAGTDATIYDPWPDFKFVNDTANNILIQARIEGDDIYFDFWGTKDGRKIDMTKPTVYNIVKPQATKLVETLDIPVGERKCTERAHNGADVYFDYTVTYSEDNIVEKRFNSHYVPWQEVCLIGVEKLSSNKDTVSTSTTEKLE